MIIGVDVSHYQAKIDWPLLKANGVEFAIVKASQGSYVDPSLKDHVSGANSAGIIVGAYQWNDPTLPYKSQAQTFLDAIAGLPISFLACDTEQFWADWSEWTTHSITKLVPATTISECARNTMAYWGDRSKLPQIVYTRDTFIDGYSRPMLTWIKNYPLWLAAYPFNAQIITTDWDTFKRQYLPVVKPPLLPEGCKTWTFHQFSGDKFILPGCTSKLDLNYFNGSLADLQAWCNITPTVTIPLTVEQRITNLEARVKILESK